MERTFAAQASSKGCARDRPVPPLRYPERWRMGPTTKEDATRVAHRRGRTSEDPDALAKIPLLAGLPPSELLKLGEHLHERAFPAGSNVLIAEQPGEAVYFVLSGSLKVHAVRPDGTEIVLAVLGPGELVGEMSFADSLGRSASVVTLEDTDLLWMDRRIFR